MHSEIYARSKTAGKAKKQTEKLSLHPGAPFRVMQMDIPPSDGLKWFGEGFDGFPKRLPDDTIEYMIYVIDAKLNDAQTRSRLNEVLKESQILSKRLLKEYIWQREAFALNLERHEDRWRLYGRTSFGDSIADEWLIVYLLRELSRKFEDAWIRMSDTDGEFLLIEAANALPKWLNPEVADHRIWLNRGQLRIKPLEGELSEYQAKKKNVTLKHVLKKIETDASCMMHSPLIEEEAFYRLQKYPSAIKDSMHTSLLTVPRKLAHILHLRPSMTSAAVEAFYLRDPISLKPLNALGTSGLTFAPEDFVTVSVRFNKTSFAQLRSQEFSIPRSWEDAPFPSSSDPKDVARREVGMKLSCGFEMLVQDAQNRDKKAVREMVVLLSDLEAGDDRLPTDTEIAEWPKIEDDESWMDINFEDFERELSGKSRDPGSKAQAASNRDEAKAPLNAGTGSDPTLNSLTPTSGFGDKSAQENLRRMVERFEKWMNDEDAGPDGADLDPMDFDDDEELNSGDDVSTGDEEDEEDKAVSFDENEFRRMMREMMGMPEEALQATLRKDESASDSDSDVEEIDGDENEEDEEIRELSRRMEEELNAQGALNLDATPNKTKAVTEAKGKRKADSAVEGDAEEDGDEGDAGVNIDYNLAKNMLEAFKGQTGMAGPAGNMMGLMGIAMPRDERDTDDKK